MGYSYYVLDDGREAGYGVTAECDHPGCIATIDRGLGYLCGRNPSGWNDPNEPGCGYYFCENHLISHDCPVPQCMHEGKGGGVCDLAKDHDGNHLDKYLKKSWAVKPRLARLLGADPTFDKGKDE